MGNVKAPSLKHYWMSSKSPQYYHPIFGNTMARNWFEAILRALRFYNQIDQTVLKKDKVNYIITHCVKNFRKVYSPPKQLSIDEALLGFKRRLSYRQYSPMKKQRFGIKLY